MCNQSNVFIVDIDHNYSNWCESDRCHNQNKKLKELQVGYEELKEFNCQQVSAYTKQPVNSTLKYLASGRKVKTYTGLRNGQSFEDLLKHVFKPASIMRYWSGPKEDSYHNKKFSSDPLKAWS